MRIQNEDLTLSGTDMTTNITSSPIWLGHIAHFAIQLVFTGSPNGSLKLQCSNDQGANDLQIAAATITNWTDVDGSTQAISSDGNHVWNVQNCGYRWVRIAWVDSASGSPSTLTSARFNVKGC